jgi:hypothetical protein
MLLYPNNKVISGSQIILRFIKSQKTIKPVSTAKKTGKNRPSKEMNQEFVGFI